MYKEVFVQFISKIQIMDMLLAVLVMDGGEVFIQQLMLVIPGKRSMVTLNKPVYFQFLLITMEVDGLLDIGESYIKPMMLVLLGPKFLAEHKSVILVIGFPLYL